jgi:phosphopantetheinyl transferase
LKCQDRHSINAIENNATHRCEFVLVCSDGANAPTLLNDGDKDRHDTTTAAKIAEGFMIFRLSRSIRQRNCDNKTKHASWISSSRDPDLRIAMAYYFLSVLDLRRANDRWQQHTQNAGRLRGRFLSFPCADEMMIRLRLIRFSHDEEAEAIEAFLGHFMKRVASFVQVSPDGTATTTTTSVGATASDPQSPPSLPEGEELYSGHHPPPLPFLSQQILRYVKNRDRWLALASCLLKSQVYHRFVGLALADDDDDDDSGKQHPQDDGAATTLPAARKRALAIELPRSPYNKPFIPLRTARRQREQEQQFIYEAFSVSHQWPFAGVAFLDNNDDDDGPMMISSSSPLRLLQLHQVGLDIVVFDPPNDRLYTSVMEFVEVFQSQFTATEWQEIVHVGRRFNHNDLLREFYLRWAVKEAYTKALGKGMHVNFAEFEFRFTYHRPSSTSSTEAECNDNNDDDDNDDLKQESRLEDGLWRWLCSQPSAAIDAGFCLPLTGTLMGTAVVGNGGSSRSTTTNNNSQWQFFFLPLPADDDDDDRPPYDDDDDDLDRSLNKKTRRAAGCACVCIGPFAASRLEEDGRRRNGIDIQTEYSSVTGLMEWHCRARGF